MPGITNTANFFQRYTEWVERESPTPDQEFAVLVWIYSLPTNPYRDATRVLEMGTDLWFARIYRDDSESVVCLYLVDETKDEGTCSGFATLREPVI